MIPPREMARLLSRVLETSDDSGTTSGGSTTTLEDRLKYWLVDWAGATTHIFRGGIEYEVDIASNTTTELTFVQTLPFAVTAGLDYSLRRRLTLTNISNRSARLLGVVDSLTKWGGTALTGRDISSDLAKLDLALTALRDAICAAGANAKTLNDLYGYLARYAQLPANLTAAGNLKLSIQESAITVPFDFQAQLRALHASTTTALAANASWTSTSEEVLTFGRITGTVLADVAGTLYVEQSPDNANWDVADSWSVSAGAGLGFSVELVGRYIGVRFLNGATAQTTFRCFAWKRVIS